MITTEGLRINREVGGKVVVVTIDRPDTRNSLDIDTFDALLKILDEQDRDPNVRVVILTGGGDKVFLSGLDIRKMKDYSPLQYRSLAEKQLAVVQKILGLGKPLIAMINGYALAAGCLLALTCDLNVASEKAKFGWPEINIGLLGGMQLMVPLVGKVRAADICFTGRTITAQEAFSLGLVNRLASPERLKEETLTLAQDIAKKSPVALKFAKKALRVALEDGPRIATMQTLELNSLCFSSQDQKEGMKAFLEKREPSYIGM